MIIVGAAGYLTGKRDGKLIDEYDVIVRPNYFGLPSNVHNGYGSRTDDETLFRGTLINSHGKNRRLWLHLAGHR